MLWKPLLEDCLTHLEAQFCFEDSIQKFAVLAAIAIVRSLVGAHDASGTCFQTIHEREDVELVGCAVIDVGTHGLTLKARVTAVLLRL